MLVAMGKVFNFSSMVGDVVFAFTLCVFDIELR